MKNPTSPLRNHSLLKITTKRWRLSNAIENSHLEQQKRKKKEFVYM